jgi:integrase
MGSGDFELAVSVNGFLRAIHRHQWSDALPADARLFDEDYPKRGELLPRALPAQVMTQVEQTANLDRWKDPAYRLITLILMRTGLRISSAAGLPFDCIVTDADTAPYLRYHNTKMKREALVPIDAELHREIIAQQQRTMTRFPAGTPLMFPRRVNNLYGRHPIGTHGLPQRTEPVADHVRHPRRTRPPRPRHAAPMETHAGHNFDQQ